ncbi:CENP-B homolog protein 2-like [Helianthus annuus]|uniref:CENP-B homolog protein 2-like n=1 Tax=Helianthus annuus TaxID=4232 RepID=UPI000B906249|nr:CENP-B homolog protein 2-like [Helianthus annuus]
MTDEIRRALCKHNKDNLSLTQKQLQEWVHSNYGLQKNLSMNGFFNIMKDMYPVDTPYFTFSIGWLGKFKARYGIKNFLRCGESGSVEMEGMEDKLKSIRDKVDQFEMKDIFNMDETGLFFRLQPDHSLATMQLEGKKQDKERLTVAICYNEDGSEKLPLWIIGKYAKPRCFKNVNLNILNVGALVSVLCLYFVTI